MISNLWAQSVKWIQAEEQIIVWMKTFSELFGDP